MLPTGPSPSLRSCFRVLAVILVVFVAACGGSSKKKKGPALTSIEVTPTSPSLAAGTSTQLVATGIYSDMSTQDVTEDVTWTSGDPAVATVDDTAGNRGFTAAAVVGTTLVTATLGDVSGETTLTVTAAVLTTLEVTPKNPSVALGNSRSFDAMGIFSDGTKQDLTASVTWDSSDTGVATSAATGIATSVSTGTTTISATQGLISDSTTLTVTPAVMVSLEVTPTDPSIALGTDQEFHAMGIYSDGTKEDLTASATWSSSATGIATVENAPGAAGSASSVAIGTTTITAASGGFMASSDLTVTSAALVSIGVTPTNPSVPLGLDSQLVAAGVYTDMTVQDLTELVTWSSSDTAIVSVSNAAGTRGLASSNAQGMVTVTATFDGIMGSTGITITPATLVSLSVTPELPEVPLGLSQGLVATGIYTDASTQDLTTTAIWSTSDPAVATVSNAGGSEGVASSSGVGTATITATHLGISGSTDLTVGSATLVSIDVTPSNPDVPLGFDQQFTATGTYSDASNQDLTANVVWSSSDAGVATVDNAPGTEGFGASVAIGSTTVTATFSGVSGSTTLTISSAVLTSIDVFVDNTAVPLGFEEALAATGFYSDGTSSDLTTTVAWTSSDTAVATVSNAAGTEGLFSTQAIGTTTISAALDGVTGTLDMDVTNAVLVSIEVTPDMPTIAAGNGQQLMATGTYSDGTTMDLTDSVTWTSTDTGVATVSNANLSEGLATGMSVGSSTINAEIAGVMGGTTVTVSSATLTTIDVTPAASTVAIGTQSQFTATGTYSDASTQDLTLSVAWSSSDTGVATISNAAGTEGISQNLAIGTTTISASLDGVTGSTTLDVADLTLVSIDVTPADTSTTAGTDVQFTATGHYNDGSTQDLTVSVSWKSSSNPTASISAKGVAKTHNPGVSDITATLDGIVGATTLTVTP